MTYKAANRAAAMVFSVGVPCLASLGSSAALTIGTTTTADRRRESSPTVPAMPMEYNAGCLAIARAAKPQTVEPTQMLGMPPQLVGAGDYGLSQNPAAAQAQLVGAGISGLGSHFGSTIFG